MGDAFASPNPPPPAYGPERFVHHRNVPNPSHHFQYCLQISAHCGITVGAIIHVPILAGYNVVVMCVVYACAQDTSLDKLLLQTSESSRPHSRLVMVQAKAQL